MNEIYRHEVMWKAKIKNRDLRRCQWFQIIDAKTGSPLRYREVLDLWECSEPFRDFFCDLLHKSRFERFRWETPAVSNKTLDRDFEFVLVNSEMLPTWGDPRAFAEHFEQAENESSQVISFSNLGLNAVLVVPTPIGSPEAYPQMAAFVRLAPPTQLHEFWQVVAAQMKLRVNDSHVWLSTAGMGVSWLHVRLDDRPKYYAWKPYKSC